MVVPLRKKTREKYGIGGDIMDDTIMAGPIVGSLSLCQVYNEIDARSSDQQTKLYKNDSNFDTSCAWKIINIVY